MEERVFERGSGPFAVPDRAQSLYAYENPEGARLVAERDFDGSLPWGHFQGVVLADQRKDTFERASKVMRSVKRRRERDFISDGDPEATTDP